MSSTQGSFDSDTSRLLASWSRSIPARINWMFLGAVIGIGMILAAESSLLWLNLSGEPRAYVITPWDSQTGESATATQGRNPAHTDGNFQCEPGVRLLGSNF